MPDPLIRGAVVLRGRRYSVVWSCAPGSLVLLPIIEPRTPWAYDVALDLADLVAAGVPLPRATVRPRPNPPMAADGHVVTGTLPGATMCRVVGGLVRGEAEAATRARWANGLPRSMAHPDMEKPVKLVG